MRVASRPVTVADGDPQCRRKQFATSVGVADQAHNAGSLIFMESHMGLLDSMVAQVLGSTQGEAAGGAPHAGLVEAIGGLLSSPQSGGLAGLVQAFEREGLGSVVASWIGTGQNQPITAQQIQAVLGSEQVRAIAQKLGFSVDDVAGQLAQWLPRVIDGLTPNGQLADANVAGGPLGGVLGGALGMLKGGLG